MNIPFLSIIILIFFMIISSFCRDKFLKIFSSINLFGVILYSSAQKDFLVFSEHFDIFFLIYLSTFLVSYCLSKGFCKVYRLKDNNYVFFHLPTYRILIFFAIGLSLSIFVFSIFRYPFLTLRSMIAERSISFYISISFPMCASYLFYLNLIQKNRQSAIATVVLFVLALISTSKIFFIIFLLFSIPWYRKGFKLSFKILFAVMLVGFSSFSLLHIITNRVVGGNDSLIKNIIFTMEGYYIGGLAAFQTFLDGTMKSYMTSGGWIKTGKWVGNVYSGFYYLFAEKSYVFFIARCFFVGFLYGVIWANASKNYFWKALSVYSVFPVCFIFFSDFFFGGWVQWCCFAAAAFILNSVKQKKSHKEMLCI